VCARGGVDLKLESRPVRGTGNPKTVTLPLLFPVSLVCIGHPHTLVPWRGIRVCACVSGARNPGWCMSGFLGRAVMVVVVVGCVCIGDGAVVFRVGVCGRWALVYGIR